MCKFRTFGVCRWYISTNRTAVGCPQKPHSDLFLISNSQAERKERTLMWTQGWNWASVFRVLKRNWLHFNTQPHLQICWITGNVSSVKMLLWLIWYSSFCWLEISLSSDFSLLRSQDGNPSPCRISQGRHWFPGGYSLTRPTGQYKRTTWH